MGVGFGIGALRLIKLIKPKNKNKDLFNFNNRVFLKQNINLYSVCKNKIK